jgi:hypothetical protein
MKKLFLIIALLLSSAQAQAQSTTVSGTITDAGGQTWNNGTVIATFVTNPNYPIFSNYTWTGGTLPFTVSGVLNGSGAYSISLPSNTAISPINSQWQFKFCPQASSPCFTSLNIPIAGATQTVAPTPPAILINLSTSVPPISAYANVELTGTVLGSQYFNLVSLTNQVCTVVSGNNCTTWTPQTSAGSLLASNNTFTNTNTFTGPTLVSTLNNTCFADQQAGADMGIKITACIATLPATGGIVDATGFQGAQTWSTNIFSATTKPILLKIGPSQVTVNTTQIPNTPNVRVIGTGGFGNSGGTGNSVLIKNIASGDLFAPGSSGVSFELANFTVAAGTVLTSGYVVNPAPAAQEGYVHNLNLLNQYGGFRIFASAATGVNSWVIENITLNCAPSTIHSGSLVTTGSTDNTVTSAGNMFRNFIETGDVCTHDVPEWLLESNTDSNQFININTGYSSANTSTQPILRIQNTLGGGLAPRLERFVNFINEAGTGAAGADVISISACNDCQFVGVDAAAGDHGVNISGGSTIQFIGGRIADNNNGGLYVTAAVTDLGLLVNGVNFYGDGKTTSNLFDDIQIAAGTTGYSIIGNMFDQQTSTVTSNIPRYMVNVLGTTTGGQYVIAGNQVKISKIGTAFVRDPTVGISKFIQDSGYTSTYMAGVGATKLILMDPQDTHTNWAQMVQQNLSNCWEMDPSTTAGGQTFSTPGLSVCNNGAGGASFVTIDSGGLLPRVSGSGDLGGTTGLFGNLWLNGSAGGNATTGSVGEYVTATLATGSSVTLGTGVTSNVTSISLTAGDWDVRGVVDYTAGATTSITNQRQGISTTSATLGGQDTFSSNTTAAQVPTASVDDAIPTPVVRISIASTTTVFLVSNATFTLSSLKAYGTISARRVR